MQHLTPAWPCLVFGTKPSTLSKPFPQLKSQPKLCDQGASLPVCQILPSDRSKSLRTHSAFLLGQGSWEANLGQRHSKESFWGEGIGLCSEGIEFLLSLPPTKIQSNLPFRQAKAFVHTQPFSPSLPSLVPTKIHEAQRVLQALPSLVPTKIHEAQGLSIWDFFGLLKKQCSLQTSKSLPTHSALLLGASKELGSKPGLWN